MSTTLFHKVYTVPSNTSFLGGVADILSDSKIPLEDWCVYVPTRQAGSDLATLLCNRTSEKVTLLPRIYSLGDVDPEELSLKGAIDAPPQPPLRRMRRQMLMAELLSQFRYQGAVLDIKQRLDLAAHLLSLLDTLQLQGVSVQALHKVETVVEGAEHWATIQKFLGLLGHHWDAIVKDAGGVDPLVWQKDMMMAHGATLSHDQPVMVAGSMGTVAATVQFMKAVQALPRGVLVLPGLIPGKDDHVLSPKDPQYALYRLLKALNIQSNTVHALREGEGFNYSTLMDGEGPILAPVHQPLALSYMVGPDTRAEGEMIALGVRQALVDGATRVLCVAPQDDLRSHIIQALEPYGYKGLAPGVQSLRGHAMGRFLHGVTLLFSKDTLLDGLRAVFMHPYTKAYHQLWQRLEHDVIRATDGIFCWDRLNTLLDNAIKQNPDLKNVLRFFQELQARLTALPPKMTMANIMTHITNIITWAVGTDFTLEDWLSAVCETDAEAFQNLWADLSYHQGIIEGHDVAPLMALFLEMDTQTPSGKRDDIFILSPADARFVEADVVFLGGVNAGAWPADGALNPFLTRRLERDLDLLPQDYFYGQSAHDFIQHLHHRKVVLSYAQKMGGATAMPSELLSYLRRFLEVQGRTLPRNQDLEALWISQRQGDDPVQPEGAPQPKVPLHHKPTRFSVSDVMSLQTNPYGFYAKHILKLRPLATPHDDPARQFGIFMHHCLEVALKSVKTRDEAIEWAFRRSFGAPADHPFLWGKVKMMVQWVLDQTDMSHDHLLETWGTFTFILNGQMLTLFAKADRIDVHEGVATLIDYKTGQIPPQSGIQAGIYPQLALEGLILTKGQFDHLPPRLALGSLAHWKLPATDHTGRIEPISCDVSALLRDTEAGLLSLLSYFQSDDAIYRAHPHGRQRTSDYDHLARTDEWYGGGL